MKSPTKKKSETAILLLTCPDRKGIVAEISHFISMYDGNILHSDQHTDDETTTFFMRIEWEIDAFAIPKERIEGAFEPIAIKFGMSWRLEFSTRKIRTALMVSKFDHCLYDLLIRTASGELDADICMVISNHPDLKPVADYFNVEFHYIPVKKDAKDEAEERQIQLLHEAEAELIILARYMQILSDRFVAAFEHKIINIHHSFLPAFVGAKPYHQAYARGVKIIGATSHYVTANLDQGPIIEQDVAAISHRDSVQDLVTKGKNLEKLVLSHAVRLHLEHKVLVFGNKTVVFD